MNKIAPKAILEQCKRWMTASEFVKLVSEQADVKERQAKNLISEAYKRKDILKHVFPDRNVIYGLPEFGPPVKTEVIEKVITPSKLGFWGFLHKRDEGKRLERDHEEELSDIRIKELDADIEVIERKFRLEHQRAERNFRRVLHRKALGELPKKGKNG